MSVATELYDESFDCDLVAVVPLAPPRPVRRLPSAPLATVSVLCPPSDAARPPVRLTRRGVVVLALLVASLGAGLLWIAALSAPTASAAPSPGPAVITVESGDTVWSIATRVAPQTDPRAEVDRLLRLNGGMSADLVPGQQLRVR